MQLNNSTEKGLAIIAILATQEESLVASSVITKRLNMSDSYTKKLLRKLVIANIVIAIPGNNGGYKLNYKLKDITLLHIVEALEGKICTYPNYGTLKNAFFEFDVQVNESQKFIENIFIEADTAWIKTLNSYNLEYILNTIFKNQIPKIDWNNLTLEN